MLAKLNTYDSNPEAWARIAAYAPSVAEMARHFYKYSDFERSLGYGNSVISHWVSGRSRVSMESERRARRWLNEHIATRQVQDVLPPQKPEPEKSENPLLLVACKDVARTKKVLELMGCEVTEI